MNTFTINAFELFIIAGWGGSIGWFWAKSSTQRAHNRNNKDSNTYGTTQDN